MDWKSDVSLESSLMGPLVPSHWSRLIRLQHVNGLLPTLVRLFISIHCTPIFTPVFWMFYTWEEGIMPTYPGGETVHCISRRRCWLSYPSPSQWPHKIEFLIPYITLLLIDEILLASFNPPFPLWWGSTLRGYIIQVDPYAHVRVEQIDLAFKGQY